MVVGGKYRESVDRGPAFFDLETDKWRHLPGVGNQPRFYHGMVSFEDKLFVFGGQDTSEGTYLDDGALLVDGKWVEVPRVLRTKRAGFAHVAVDKATNYVIC